MPSLTADQLKAAHASFPYTNKMILDSHDRGSYLVVDVKQDEAGTTIFAHPDVEVAVKNNGFSVMINEQFGSTPNTRSDIQNGKEKIGSRRLLTLGGIITLEDSEGNTGIPLHIRNGSMPLPNLLTYPSGLASEKPSEALWQRINDEAGYCFVDAAKKELNVIVMQPDRETLEMHPKLLGNIINNKMQNQRNIRLAVAEKTGIQDITNTDKWNINIVRVDSKFDFSPAQVNAGLIDHVQFGGLLSGQPVMPACVHNDAPRQTVTLTVPLRAKLPVPFTQMLFIDPEGFGRKASLLSEADLSYTHAGKIPALVDYISKLNGEIPASPRVKSIPVSPAPAPAAA